MVFVKKLEFGNYTLRFGEEVLLDYYDDIVFPSFLEMNHIRKFGDKSEFFFIDTECVVLNPQNDPPVLGIKGRIVKNTVLSRDQIFDGSVLVEDHDEMETAPSSFFLLILNTHRLILCQEVANAPTIQNFQSTSQYCLNKQYENYINELYLAEVEFREQNPDLPRITKKSLREETPAPKLRVTTLTDAQTLEDFINSFEKINNVTVKLLPTNQEEIDNDSFWDAVNSASESTGSNNTTMRFSNNSQGLNAEPVLEQLTSATKLANSAINIKGYDDGGEYLKGDNNTFSLTSEIEELATDTIEAATQAYAKFEELVNLRKISLPAELPRKTIGILRRIFERFS
ncbi:hypothetical protein KSU19_12785 [Enterobacter quasiroggenkampii]|uniref:hypothetical protein n=1 Tax=Enterobacter quasiroggenkampii TaxID=2497436 RepID=UPI0021D02A99|nr:hypothetical protein [Enterobacter quasiroggenkampii]MCU6328529.1 hypothetical protein [Enterobacter quasiroggenkampii]